MTELRFNAPTTDEVLIVIVGKNLEARDIILLRRNYQLQLVYETHSAHMMCYNI